MVIEAAGAQAGVCTSLITNKKWTHWGMLKGVRYEEGEEDTMTATVVLPVGKQGKTVNMREKASTGSSIVKVVPVGSKVDIYEDMGEWCRIGYSGYNGYMMSDYLEYGQEDETGDATLTPEESRKLDNLIGHIEQAAKDIFAWSEAIGSIIGRG